MSVHSPKAPKARKAPFKSSTDRWENEGGPASLADAAVADVPEAYLQKLGITPVRLTVFDCAGYRYTNLRDAVAAGKREIETRAN